MSSTPGYTISDRAVIFDDAAIFEEFVKDPKAYLTKIGALDGLPAFNGVRLRDDSTDLRPLLDRMNRSADAQIICHHHRQDPYMCLWCCGPIAEIE